LWPKKKPEENTASITFHNTEEIEKEIKGFEIEKAPFSSTLTPNELYLLRKSGFEPIQVVFGNVVFSMGLRGVFRSFIQALKRGEMVDFSRLNEDARVLARNRMLKEAAEIKADGVVSVSFDIREYADFMEVVAIGTAVRKTTVADLPEPSVAV